MCTKRIPDLAHTINFQWHRTNIITGHRGASVSARVGPRSQLHLVITKIRPHSLSFMNEWNLCTDMKVG